MPEPTPRKNCQSCGATVCFDKTCDPAVVARADAFIALAPPGFVSHLLEKGATVKSDWTREASRWARSRGLYAWSVTNVVRAAARRCPRVLSAITFGDFAGWPELDAAFRLGGHDALFDLIATIIPEPKS